MDPSGSELQELRRLVAELTARVFRIEQALNLPAGAAAEQRREPQISVAAAQPEPKSIAPVIPSVAPSLSASDLASKPRQRRPGIPHRFALAEPDRHCRCVDWRFVLSEICFRQ